MIWVFFSLVDATAVYWLKEGRKLIENERVKMIFDGVFATLVIKDITSLDIACYECVATSSKRGEEARTSSALTVKRKPHLFFS